MCSWLERCLPKLTDDWWDDLVYNNLSQIQKDQVSSKKISELNDLDLITLLQVFDRNWFIITSLCLVNIKERQTIKNMMSVCNSWAHITLEDVSKEKVLKDIKIIVELMQAFGSTMNETKEMKAFAMDVDNDNDIRNLSVSVINPMMNLTLTCSKTLLQEV